MSEEQRYKRDANGQRFQMGGINTVLPSDALPAGKYPYLQNVRAYLQGRVTGRATQGADVETLPSAVHSLRRLNDTTPNGPVSGYSLIGGAGNNLYCNATQVATGLSGNRLALVPFRPNSSPQPWMYVGDSAKLVKVRSDGVTFKTGIKEPQNSPDVGTETTTVSGNVIVLGTARPWSNVSGLNPSFNYGDNGNGTGTVIIATPTEASTVTLTATGTCTVSGVAHGPGDAGGTASGNPGHFTGGSCYVLCGAWTDASGNIVAVAGIELGALSIGANAMLTVPAGATQLQLGVDGTGGAFSGNTGQFNVAYSISTSAVSSKVSLLGDVTAYYWGDSPHSGPVASYIWKNAGDTAGSGPTRSIADASGNTTNNSLRFDSTPSTGANPVLWDILSSTGSVTGNKPVFQPALESEGYQDFNMCITGNLFVPAAGTYTFTATAKDNLMWGIGNNASWPGVGTIKGVSSQTETVLSQCPLLPSPSINGSGAATTVSVQVTFPGQGIYPIECDWDYWYHNGRTMVVQVNGADIPPLTGSVKENVQYRYNYRGSSTGAKSNPSPSSLPQQVPSISNTITAEFSPDPQVDKIDYWRLDSVLDNFTYVGTGQNANPPAPFTDQLLDQDVSANPLLEFDNYEPFPSIDLPRKGVVNVIGGVVEWVSGDQFNLRWLGGTIINIGGIAYTLYNRPSSATNLLAVDVADGTNLIYEIAEPILAAQSLASMWGDTDNAAYVFACGDPLRPGTLYWSKGNNLDSAPDTNQVDVTSPSEPLVNGVIANGIGLVLSAENGWSIFPNFSAALATVTGVEGSPFSLVRSGVTRGLYIRTAICTDGSGMFFYRSKDGVEMASAGGRQQSVTDEDLYNLFPHEGFVPGPITIGGYTIYPPDDTQPERQSLRFATGYLYYDYVDTTATARTLVYDVAGKGWIVDAYQYPATIHVLEEGPNINGVLVGCVDGSIRPLQNGGTETGNCVVLTAAQNGGDARANKSVGDLFVRASVQTSAVSVTPYFNQYAMAVTSYTPTTLIPGSGLAQFIIDFPAGLAADLADIELLFSWAMGTGTYLDLWQADWTDLPENTKDRPSDWTDAGQRGAMFVQGLTLEANTFGVAKAIQVQAGDDLSFHVPDQSPVTFSGQSKQTLTFTPPFVAHNVRIVSTDGVPWRYWGASWIALPFPPLVVEWQTEKTSLGMNGWLHIREFNVAHISTHDLTLTLTFDPGAVPQQIVLIVPNSGGLQAKTKITCLPNKFKLVDFRLSSSAPFRVFEEDFECKAGPVCRQGAYTNVRVIGGESAGGARA